MSPEWGGSMRGTSVFSINWACQEQFVLGGQESLRVLVLGGKASVGQPYARVVSG